MIIGRYPKPMLEDPSFNVSVINGRGAQVGECANLAGCKDDIMECLPAPDGKAEDAASSSGVPVCMVCVRVNSENIKKKCSKMFGKFSGDAEGVEKPYFRTIRKW